MTIPEPVVKATAALLPLSQLNYALGSPPLRAIMKQEFNDFCVDESIGFALTGSGEHFCLRLRKTDLTTLDVAQRIATLTGTNMADIGYCGMKDKHAVCTQWFSLPLEMAAEGRIASIEDDCLEILETDRNIRKIKIGSHKSNQFRIILRQCAGKQSEFDARLLAIKQQGAPNYFGAQRFGRQLSNITQLLELIATIPGLLVDSSSPSRPKSKSELNLNLRPRPKPKLQRHKRSMLYSAGRAYLFNQLLCRRLQLGNWNRYIAGDVLNLNGTSRYFLLKGDNDWDQALQERLDGFDIHISGPLAGSQDLKDKYISSGEAADIEYAVLQQFQPLLDGLQYFGLKAARRPLRFMPTELEWRWLDASTLELRFGLGRGSYATSLLRELCGTDQVS